MNDLNNKTNEESHIYIENLVYSIKDIFDDRMSLSRLVNDIYECLIADGYKDNQIYNGRVDKRIFKYLFNQYFGVKFNEKYKDAFNKVFRSVYNVYQERERYARGNSSDPFYMTSSPQEKSFTTFVILCHELMSGVTLDELTRYSYDDYVFNFINNERVKSKSVSDKEVRRARREQKDINLDSLDDIRRAVIIGAILFGFAALGKAEYEIKEAHKEKHNNKPKHEAVVKNSPNYNTIYVNGMNARYNAIDNEIILGGS